MEPEFSVLILAHQIAGTVVDRPVTVLAWILAKPPRGLLAVGIIAEPDARAADPQFADIAARDGSLMLVENEMREIVVHAAERRKFLVGYG